MFFRWIPVATVLLVLSACAGVGQGFPDVEAAVDGGVVGAALDGGSFEVGLLDAGPQDGGAIEADTADGASLDSAVGDPGDLLDGGVSDAYLSDGSAPLDGVEEEIGDLGPPKEDAGPAEEDVAPPPCDDDNPCTDDSLSESGQCEYIYTYGICCNANPHCDDGDSCTDDVCVDGMCTHVAGCCEADIDCDDGESLCTADVCIGGHCVHQPTGAEGCCAPGLPLVDVHFDQGQLAPFVIQNNVAVVGWQLVESETAPSPPGALWYGNATTGDYAGTGTSAGLAILPDLVVPGGNVRSYLSFDVFLDVQAGLERDLLELRLVDKTQSPPREHVVWHKGKVQLYGGWFSTQAELTAWSGRTVSLRFRFDTVDPLNNDGEGVFIDNVVLVSPSCEVATCFSTAECQDGQGVTLDFCISDPAAPVTDPGVCSYAISSAFCSSYLDCDDGDPCTYDNCDVNEQCSYVDNPSCCLDDATCDDGDPCTVNDCVGAYNQYGGYCVPAIPIPECCLVAADCDDGDPCTVDACPGFGEACAHVAIAGCCTAHEDCADSDPCTDDLCVAGACSQKVVCCAADAGCDDGDDLCTLESCVEGVCQTALDMQPGCCTQIQFGGSFSGTSWDGWSAVDDSNGGDGVSWQPLAQPSWSQPGAMHYGAPGGTYDTGMANSGAVESPPFFLPATTESWVSFWVLMDTEYPNGAATTLEWDRLVVTAFRADLPSEAITVWDSADGEPVYWTEAAGMPLAPNWTHVTQRSLTALRGRMVRLRFAFDTFDSDANAFGGPTFDDVAVMSTCGP